ncbi:hypothetical protein [Nonomuraea rubra]|uniref:hypothetical protein n=1 Tax=Nonomuraea rubra TaxID=46180 RepID=UPI003CD07F20
MRAILTNPRYVGHQVWNRQGKHEVLMNVDDVQLGHTTRLSGNAKEGLGLVGTGCSSADRVQGGLRCRSDDADRAGQSPHGQDS